MDIAALDDPAFASVFTSDFVTAVAAAAGVPTASIRVTAVAPGSVVVTFEAVLPSVTAAQAFVRLAETPQVRGERPEGGSPGLPRYHRSCKCESEVLNLIWTTRGRRLPLHSRL